MPISLAYVSNEDGFQGGHEAIHAVAGLKTSIV